MHKQTGMFKSTREVHNEAQSWLDASQISLDFFFKTPLCFYHSPMRTTMTNTILQRKCFKILILFTFMLGA